jgi:thioredoxin reductase
VIGGGNSALQEALLLSDICQKVTVIQNLPTFTGEPERVELSGDIDSFTETIWNNLNEQNKISLYVRYIDLETGKTESRMINKNK